MNLKSKSLLLGMLLLSTLFVKAQVPTRQEVMNDMQRVADWQIKNFSSVRHSNLDWTCGAFYIGLVRWAELAEKTTGNTSYYDWMVKLGEKNKFHVGRRNYHADDITVAQSYLQLYKKYQRKEMYEPMKLRADYVISHDPKDQTMYIDYKDSLSTFRWTWCDALFMAGPVYMQLYNITGDKKYMKFLDREYKASYDFLYDKDEHLFYRDHRFFPENVREANGQKQFWGRGNGWVVGGLAEMLREFPAKYKKSKKFYSKLFVEMCTRVAGLQNEDGYWRASMLDPGSYPSPETSCSGFFVYALAYGVNSGLLPREEFLPVVLKGWKALTDAVEPDGKLGFVQPIGHDPKSVTRDMTEVYGPGAFLLAGTEVYKLAK